MVEKVEIIQPAPVEVKFEETRLEGWCSENVCSRGHKWVPTVGIAKCGGCGAPVLARMMENCPWCFEPVERFKLRTDHLARGGVVTAMCKGQVGMAEVGVIEMECGHAREVEENGEKFSAGGVKGGVRDGASAGEQGASGENVEGVLPGEG